MSAEEVLVVETNQPDPLPSDTITKMGYIGEVKPLYRTISSAQDDGWRLIGPPVPFYCAGQLAGYRWWFTKVVL